MPLELVVGWVDFCGRRIAVHSGVFVPRRRSEFLASTAVALAQRTALCPVIVDLCCGSGAIAKVIKLTIKNAEVYAADIDARSVRSARQNLGQDAEVFEGDLFDDLPSKLLHRVDLIVANAPYVPTDALEFLPADARLYEPRVALDGGPDGSDLHRRIAAECHEWLSPDGVIVIETSHAQATGTVEVFRENGLFAVWGTDANTDATIVSCQRISEPAEERRH
jgi:release factor glutamine methyltransferase